ncbi:MAG: hypothetical protein M1817_006304 [Caeruleum heppii]|nr:MAG: hypothetical protein M1817_006304 [Caeruleum heppii]
MPVYSNQQQPQSRTTSMGAARLQNGKLGSGSGWGFGLSTMGGAPGLPNPQSRPNSAALTSFAQTIGGSQSATPLDLSEFPSLSGAPSQNQQNPAQAAWGNAPQRVASHTAVQRPQPQSQSSSIQPSSSQGQPQQPSQPSQQQQTDNPFSSASHFGGGLEDLHFRGQDGVGQLSGSSQPKTGSIDEFPPLSRNANGEIGRARDGSMMSAAGFGGQTNGNAFGAALGQMQSLQGRTNFLGSGQQDSSRQPGLNGRVSSPMGLGSGALSATRSPIDMMQQGLNEPDRSGRSTQASSNLQSLFSNAPNASQNGQATAASQPQSSTSDSRQSQSQPSHQAFTGDLVESPKNAQGLESLSSMSEIDRYGLAGLLQMIRNEDSDIGALAIGQDLTSLGLDLNQPEHLNLNFSTPFAEPGSRTVEPEFTLPSCYTVKNIQPLHTKVSSFSDETLFYIFYEMTRDVMQEVAASELTNRNWRYHKQLKQWLTKDTNFEPVRLNPAEERGFYIFFDPISWQRQRREFLLQYDALDGRPIGPIQTAGA